MLHVYTNENSVNKELFTTFNDEKLIKEILKKKLKRNHVFINVDTVLLINQNK